MASPAETILAPVRAAAERAGLADFLRWWADELSAAVPVAWRERFASRGTAFVRVEADQWQSLRPASGKLVKTGHADLGSLDEGRRRAAFRRLVEEAASGAPNVWLVLPDEAVLVRTVTLPLAAEEAIRDALGFELDRLTPFAQEHACFDHRLTGRDPVAQQLSIGIAVTARAPVEARLAQLRELGATVLGVGVAGDVAACANPFNLLAPEDRDRPATSRTVIVGRALATIAGLLAVVALAYPLWQKREAVIELQPRLEKAKGGADVADRLAREIEKLASEHNFLVAKKQALYPAVLVLEDLSRLLPDTTWVQQLDVKAGPKLRELQIAGETGSSSQLIEVLEKSGSLANASFKSPLTKGVTPGTERFLVSAEVKPRAVPEPMPESALAPASPAQPAGGEKTHGADTRSASHEQVPASAPAAPPASMPAPVSPPPAAIPPANGSPATGKSVTAPATSPPAAPVKPATKG